MPKKNTVRVFFSHFHFDDCTEFDVFQWLNEVKCSCCYWRSGPLLSWRPHTPAHTLTFRWKLLPISFLQTYWPMKWCRDFPFSSAVCKSCRLPSSASNINPSAAAWRLSVPAERSPGGAKNRRSASPRSGAFAPVWSWCSHFEVIGGSLLPGVCGYVVCVQLLEGVHARHLLGLKDKYSIEKEIILCGGCDVTHCTNYGENLVIVIVFWARPRKRVFGASGGSPVTVVSAISQIKGLEEDRGEILEEMRVV